jgi:hypothetical protein
MPPSRSMLDPCQAGDNRTVHRTRRCTTVPRYHFDWALGGLAQPANRSKRHLLLGGLSRVSLH